MSLRAGSGRRVTIREVAGEAGVSIKTVSRVLNGEPRVAAATAEKVLAAAARLGYRPNELARGLKGSRTQTIGLIIADISNPFFADCCRAIEQVAARRELALMLCASSEDVESERRYVDLLSRRRIDGLLIVPAPDGDGDHLRQEISAGLPVVAFDRPAAGVETDTVIVSNREGAKEATEHLLGHGRRRIAFIGDAAGIYTADKRLAGYRQAIEAADLEPVYRMGSGTISAACRTAEELLREYSDLDAFLGGNSLISAGILRALERTNTPVPDPVALICFDDFQLLSVLRPDLTVIRQPTRQLGNQAVTMLLERLDGSTTEEPRRTVLPTELLTRSSCGCTPRATT